MMKCQVYILIIACIIMNVNAGHRDKRLVLHADTDIVAEVLKLREEMDNQKAHIANLTESNDKLSRTLGNLQAAFNTDTNSGTGSVYIRWGRTVCTGHGSSLIYKGYMAGSEYRSTGNGANHLCLPEDPSWAKYTDGSQSGDRAYIYGTEYDEYKDIIFGKHIMNEDVPCAVCLTTGVSVMIPARTNCYPGWNLEYTGYLMADFYSHPSPTEYICVDADPEFVDIGQTSSDTNGHLLYLVEARCGTLVCPPYVDYRELACSVCSKG